MAGLKPGAPTPDSITVHSQSRVLEVEFSDGAHFRLPFELLRVYSPSAEVRLNCGPITRPGWQRQGWTAIPPWPPKARPRA